MGILTREGNPSSVHETSDISVNLLESSSTLLKKGLTAGKTAFIMKISYYIPKDKKGCVDFINKEINSSSNIKSKDTKQSVLLGLNKIKSQLTQIEKIGRAFFWDGKYLEVMVYYGKDSLYYCGNNFNHSPIESSHMGKYFFVTMDADRCTIGKLVGKRIIKLWDEESNVPRKQDAGGQSALRFQRARENALKQWFKKCASVLYDFYRQETQQK